MVRKNSSKEELENIGVNLNKVLLSYLDRKGLPSDENKAVAKTSELPNGDIVYYIKYRRGELFDPYGIDEMKINALDTKYKKVDKYIFESYVKYLETRLTAYLSEARRDFVRKGY